MESVDVNVVEDFRYDLPQRAWTDFRAYSPEGPNAEAVYQREWLSGTWPDEVECGWRGKMFEWMIGTMRLNPWSLQLALYP